MPTLEVLGTSIIDADDESTKSKVLAKDRQTMYLVTNFAAELDACAKRAKKEKGLCGKLKAMEIDLKTLESKRPFGPLKS